MSSQSVTVSSPEGGTVKHDGADGFSIEGGHLMVHDGRGAVAVYAPGAWASAFKGGEIEPKE